MRNVGLVTDARFRRHRPGPGHPECPERLEVLERLFAGEPFAGLPRIEPRAASQEELGRVHGPAHLRAVAASRGRPLTRYDADTTASEHSFDAALLAAGSAIALTDAVMDGRVERGFAALRPPGHHAEHDRPMGFCFFNNVAVAARHLRLRHGLERVLIIDWDVHHGNGSQHSFYDDESVMYASVHQYPFYPGTGAAAETGSGEGAGTTVNLPMPAGAGDDDYSAAWREVLVPAATAFDPDFVLVSAGFDAHRDDPLAMVELSTEAFGRMTDAVSELADQCAGGRTVVLLEGGYSLEALAASVGTVVERLAGPERPEFDSGELGPWGEEARKALSAFWPL